MYWLKYSSSMSTSKRLKLYALFYNLKRSETFYLWSFPLKRLSGIIAIINRCIHRRKIRILKQHAFIQTLLTYIREALFWNTCRPRARVTVLLTWPPSGRIATSAWSGAASGHAEVVGHWPHDDNVSVTILSLK